SASTVTTASANDGAREKTRAERRRSDRTLRMMEGRLLRENDPPRQRIAWRQYHRRAAPGSIAARAANSSSRSPSTKSRRSAETRHETRRAAGGGGAVVISPPGGARGRRPWR